MGRARSRNPKRHQHCLRLTDQQEELLQRYAEFRGYNTDMDAIRGLIDGLDDWFLRQEAKLSSQLSALRPGQRGISDGEQRSPVATHDVMEPEDPIDVVALDGHADAESTSVGDFGGRPRVSLPESRHDGND